MKEIKKLAREAGLIDKSDILLRRAKRKLGVIAEPVKEAAETGKLLITGWRWRLPDDLRRLPDDLLGDLSLRTLNEHLKLMRKVLALVALLAMALLIPGLAQAAVPQAGDRASG
ncbi:MAG: hypothetical protein XD69_1289 [Clostridia bacterium 62_21]|nr:MAG: hypothetical protein XD69_1289 [Clostridia bacterium 62_21]HAG07013.1 hypothetical protein [Peptococcaceae bacterium]